ncbi:hypothetical protein MIR68_012328 [Amoeboaphelidium protococcarum]|nr:hypothetical protein MIR68_012328 [Amoeboaphelidium protococcarum]
MGQENSSEAQQPQQGSQFQPSNTQQKQTSSSSSNSSPLQALRKFGSTPQLLNAHHQDTQKKNKIAADYKLGKITYDEMPDDAVLDKEIEQVVIEMGLPGEKIEAIRQLSRDKKFMLLKQHKTTIELFKTHKAGEQATNLKSVDQYLAAIKQKVVPGDLLKELLSLEVALRTLPVSWVGDFIAQDGIGSLLTLFKQICLKIINDPQERECQIQMIRCFKTLMNNAIGLSGMINYPQAISVLSLGLDCSNIKIKAMLLDLLGAVSVIPPNGHQLVIEAMEYFKKCKFEKFRFQSIVQTLHIDDLDYRLSCMVFLNTLVNSPEDLEVRVQIRNEFIGLNLTDVIDDLKDIGSSDLNNQIYIFEDEAANDFADLNHDLPNLAQFDINDHDQLFAAIKLNVNDEATYDQFLRVMQQIYVMTAGDQTRKSQFWKILNQAVQEMVMQRNGLHFDFHKFNFKINQLIEGFAKEELFQQQQADLDSMRKQLSVFGKDMETVQSLLIEREQELTSTKEQLSSKQEQVIKLESDIMAQQHKMELQATKIQELRHDRNKNPVIGGKISVDEWKFPSQFDVSSDLKSFIQTSINNSIEHMKAQQQQQAIKNIGTSFTRTDSERSLTDTTSAGQASKDGVDKSGGSGNQDGDQDQEDIFDSYGDSTDAAAPPPPPPPMMSPNAPPPPPFPGMPSLGGQQQQQKSRLITQPKSKMRQMQWDKLASNNLGSTFWQQLHDNEILQKQLDFSEIENTFGIVDKVVEKKKDSSTEKEVKVINLLDAKKSYNMSIMLSRIKMTYPEIRLAILGLSEDLLSESFIRQLLLYIPTQEEQTMLTENLDQYGRLGKPEQFYIEIMKISRYEQRLKSLLFKRHFSDRVAELTKQLQTILSASKEITDSPKLRRLLEIVLWIGNFMNSNSFKGNAFGFKVTTIGKLADIRTNGKGTFLNYLDTLIIKRFLELKNFADELSSVDKASKLQLQAVMAEFMDLKRGMESLRNEVDLHSDNDDQKDKFYSVMKTFLGISSAQYTALEKLKTDCEAAVKGVYDYFGEEDKTPIESIFLIFAQFLQSFDRARKENERDEELARKALELEIMEKKRKEERQNKFKEQVLGDTNRRGVMDDLISSLKNGEVMKKNAADRREYKRESRLLKQENQALDAEKLLEQLRLQYS